MNKKNIIDKFVSSTFEFKAHDRLIVNGQKKQLPQPYHIAADSRKRCANMINLGTLAIDDEKVLVRVFKDIEKEKYDLYFLSEDNRFSQFPILFEPTSFKYFIINQAGHAEIPFSSVIDPIQQSLSISYPLMSTTFDLNRVREKDQDELAEVKRHDDKVTLTISDKCSKALFVFSTDNDSSISRLVPVRHGEAIVSIPENAQPEVCISIFE